MKHFRIQNISVVVPDQVYPPSEDTFLLMKLLNEFNKTLSSKTPIKHFMEIGCGSGLVSIYARRIFQEAVIVVTDINSSALETTRNNIISNGENLKHYQFINSNLLNSFSSTIEFDLVVFNPPYLPTDRNWQNDFGLKNSIEGGINGSEVINSFLNELISFQYIRRLGLIYSNMSYQMSIIPKLPHLGFKKLNSIEETFSNEKIIGTLWNKKKE